MKTSKKDREQLREVAADYTGLGSLGIAPMLVVRLLDDLDTQESELTKLRKRVEVLSEALSFYSNRKNVRLEFDEESCHNYFCEGNDLAEWGTKAREALAASAKIAGSMK